MTFNLNFPRACSSANASGLFRVEPEDFFVEEIMDIELEGEGEHVWLWVEKRGQNTAFVAKQLARIAKVREMDVGYSGLKDRHAVTRQWFSVYLGNRPEPEWQEEKIEGCQLIRWARHRSKLRRGEHQANEFRIVARELTNAENIEDLLQAVKEVGFPNYFGQQRFGRDGSNLERGEKYFSGSIKASKAQRGFYISAARSYLFNLNLAASVEERSWLDDGRTGPMYGDIGPNDKPLSEREIQILEDYPIFAKGIHANRLKLETRAMKILPKNMSWKLETDMLVVNFRLPVGAYATSLLRELGDFVDASQLDND